MTKIGILHPGEMGVSIAASAAKSGHEIFWSSINRSAKTRSRAEQHNFSEIITLGQLCGLCEIIISVCPPDAAKDVAKSVIAEGFKGYYLDANAISPQHAVEIERLMTSNGCIFIDGGIIGGPAWKINTTQLYLSGKYSRVIADCFSNGPLGIKIIGDEIGKASALKMCFAAYSKGSAALLTAILATAESLGIRNELYQHWDIGDAKFSEQSNRRVINATRKAWRFEGEMIEIASTFKEAGMPGGFHEAAAEIYHRLSGFKDSLESPLLEEVLMTLLSE